MSGMKETIKIRSEISEMQNEHTIEKNQEHQRVALWKINKIENTSSLTTDALILLVRPIKDVRKYRCFVSGIKRGISVDYTDLIWLDRLFYFIV